MTQADTPAPMPPGKRRRLLRDVIAGKVTVEEYVAVVKREVDELLATIRLDRKDAP